MTNIFLPQNEIFFTQLQAPKTQLFKQPNIFVQSCEFETL